MLYTSRVVAVLGVFVLAGCTGDPDQTRDVETHDAADTADGDETPDTAVDSVDDTDDTSDGVDTIAERLALYCPGDAIAVEARIDAILATLSIDEKAALMHGDTTMASNNIWPMRGLPEREIPGLVMSDGPRGANHRINGLGATAFPVAAMRGATWDVALERRVGEVMATEARAIGAHVLLAPTMNLLRHPRWGRAQETYGEDPWHVGSMAVAFVEGVQSQGVIAVAKHFALNSIEDTRFDVDVLVDQRALQEIYLPHFRRVVRDASVAGVMTSYNQVNGAYCAENAPLVRDILKTGWEFQGFVVSDWVFGTQSTVPSLQAGLDIEMPGSQYYGRSLADAVRTDASLAPLLDDAVRRVLRATFCYGADTNPPPGDRLGLESPEHLALAREVAARGTVLLENRNNTLPLDRSAVARVVLLGRAADVENIGDEGSSRVQATDVVTALEGITAALPDAEVLHIATTTPDENELTAIEAADLVLIVTGLLAEDEGESLIAAGDRTSLELRADEVALIELANERSDNVVVILEGGSTIAIGDWRNDVEALLFAFYPGTQGGHAIADVLFGDVNPSGRLPVSFVAGEADLPVFDNTSLEVVYDMWHGYWWLQRDDIAPVNAFGYGRSYSDIALRNLVIERTTLSDEESVVIRVDLAHIGGPAGRETAQVYISPPTGPLERPEQMLQAFAQLALQPNEETTHTFTIPLSQLAYFDNADAGWVVASGEYTVRVGTSAESLPLQATFVVQSTPVEP